MTIPPDIILGLLDVTAFSCYICGWIMIVYAKKREYNFIVDIHRQYLLFGVGSLFFLLENLIDFNWISVIFQPLMIIAMAVLYYFSKDLKAKHEELTRIR